MKGCEQEGTMRESNEEDQYYLLHIWGSVCPAVFNWLELWYGVPLSIRKIIVVEIEKTERNGQKERVIYGSKKIESWFRVKVGSDYCLNKFHSQFNSSELESGILYERWNSYNIDMFHITLCNNKKEAICRVFEKDWYLALFVSPFLHCWITELKFLNHIIITSV